MCNYMYHLKIIEIDFRLTRFDFANVILSIIFCNYNYIIEITLFGICFLLMFHIFGIKQIWT